jgi:hypothetical protein
MIVLFNGDSIRQHPVLHSRCEQYTGRFVPRSNLPNAFSTAMIDGETPEEPSTNPIPQQRSARCSQMPCNRVQT